MRSPGPSTLSSAERRDDEGVRPHLRTPIRNPSFRCHECREKRRRRTAEAPLAGANCLISKPGRLRQVASRTAGWPSPDDVPAGAGQYAAGRHCADTSRFVPMLPCSNGATTHTSYDKGQSVLDVMVVDGRSNRLLGARVELRQAGDWRRAYQGSTVAGGPRPLTISAGPRRL